MIFKNEVSSGAYLGYLEILLILLQTEKDKTEEKRKFDEEDMERLMTEKERGNQEILALKQELEVVKKMAEARCQQIEAESMGAKMALEERVRELECQLAVSKRKVRDLEACSESRNQGVQELELQLIASRKRLKQLEIYSETKDQFWHKKGLIFRSFMDSQLDALQVGFLNTFTVSNLSFCVFQIIVIDLFIRL